MSRRLDTVEQRQLFSSIGQVKLINLYYDLFREYHIPVGQLLTMKESFATRREYLILCLLIQHPNYHFTREEIMVQVWPNDTLVNDRSVDVHIARLRKKLGSEGRRITNRTGFGYALTTDD